MSNHNNISSQDIREGQKRKNEIVEMMMNIGEVIKYHRIRKGLRIQDVCNKVKEKYGEDIHPTIYSRYENNKLPIKSLHIAYILDILDIYLEDLFPQKVVILDLKHFITNLKFQYLVKELRKFFSDDQIQKIIHQYLEKKLDFIWDIITIYEKKFLNLKISEQQNKNNKEN